MDTGFSLHTLTLLGFWAAIILLGVAGVISIMRRDPNDRFRLPLRALYHFAGFLPLLALLLLGLLGVMHRVEYGLWPADPWSADHRDPANPLAGSSWAGADPKFAFPLLYQLSFVVGAVAVCSVCIMVLVAPHVISRRTGTFARSTLWTYCTCYVGLWAFLLYDPGGWFAWWCD